MSDLPDVPLRPDESHLTEWQRFRRTCEREIYWQYDKGEYYSFNKLFAILEHLFDPQSPKDLTADKLALLDGYMRNQMHLAATTSSRYHHTLAKFLKFAECRGLIDHCPVIRIKEPKVKNRGRPVTRDEFKRMEEHIRHYSKHPSSGKRRLFLLRGLWHSGLRIGEACKLTWHPSPFCIDLSGRKPMYRVASGGDKSQTFKRFPIAPPFVKMLLAVPEEHRHGFVFGTQSRFGARAAIVEVAKKVGAVTVGLDGKEHPVTPHDFRRSFAVRWAKRLTPDKLMLIMRHTSFETTAVHYLNAKSEDAADDMWRYCKKRNPKFKIPKNENFVVVREVVVDKTAWPYVAYVPPGLGALG